MATELSLSSSSPKSGLSIPPLDFKDLLTKDNSQTSSHLILRWRHPPKESWGFDCAYQPDSESSSDDLASIFDSPDF
jgi:hypothetical protein